MPSSGGYLQTALPAQRAGESSALVVACRLHDLGHLLPDVPEAEAFEEERYHEEQGARWLAVGTIWLSPSAVLNRDRAEKERT